MGSHWEPVLKKPLPVVLRIAGKVLTMKLPTNLFRWLRSLILVALLGAVPGVSFAQIGIGISITIAPPVLPVYEQPLCPGPNYMWTPGYWAYGPMGYYWVPGTWVIAPAVGLLWTPGYWGWGNGIYLWHAGYWGPHIGFYGGVNYGFGYGGVGFGGGRWVGNSFSYNTAVVNVNRTVITNVYVDKTVIINNNVNRVSFNGGQGGIQARATPAEQQAFQQKRFNAVAAQTRQADFARNNKANWASQNHGAPQVAALQRPATSAAEFTRAAVPARPAPGARPTPQPANRPAPGNRPENNARPVTRPTQPAQRPETRPAPATRPAPQPAQRPAQPAQRPETRPAPAARPAQPAAHPAARPAARPAQEKPAPRPESHPEPK
jgi:hypothetical protein